MVERSEEKKSRAKKDSRSAISIRSYFTACLHNWYWFVLSVLIVGCLAYLYGK